MSNRMLKLASLTMMIAVLGACDGSSLMGPEDTLTGTEEVIDSQQAQAADDAATDGTDSQTPADQAEDQDQVKPQR